MPETSSPPLFDGRRPPPGTQPLTADDPRELGGYRLVGRLGAGGMGSVYAGVDAEGRCAAVKVIHPQFAADPEFRTRFAREVDLVRRVAAACTPAFHGADARAQTPWLATEYVPGPTLHRHVTEQGPLTGGMLPAFAAGLAEALAAIHAAGVVHRDLKPGNVILAPDGPKVLDFGIARAAEETALTATGALIGTVGWIAPEQYSGEPATDRSDMFAWGGLAAFAATGRSPFGTGIPDLLAYRTRNEEPDLAGVPEELYSLVERALAKDPVQRPSAADALAELTGRWNATRPLPPTGTEPTDLVPALLAAEWRGPDLPAPRSGFRATRRPLLLAGAGLAVAVLAAGGWMLSGVGPDLPLPSGGEEASEEGGAAGGEAAGDDGGEEAAQAVPAVQEDPGDTGAVLAEALELAMSAESFEAVRHVQGAEQPVLGSTTTTYRYTEEPEPAFHYLRTGEGAMYEERLGLGEDHGDVLFRRYDPDPFHRDPEAEEHDLAEGHPDIAVEHLNMIAATSEDIDYTGREELTEGPASAEELVGRSGHRYTGTFTSQEPSHNAATGEWEYSPREGTPFELWIDDDGYPLRVRHTYEYIGEGPPQDAVEETGYLHFGEHVGVEVPPESEIEPTPPPDLGP